MIRFKLRCPGQAVAAVGSNSKCSGHKCRAVSVSTARGRPADDLQSKPRVITDSDSS